MQLLLGLIALSLSFLQVFLPLSFLTSSILGFFAVLFMIGAILVSDALAVRFGRPSFLRSLLFSRRRLLPFLLLSIIGGLLLEAVANWIGKLWIYPYFSVTTYIFVLVPGYFIYWLMIYGTYYAARAAVGRWAYSTPREYKRLSHLLYPMGGLIAAFVLPVTLWLIFRSYFLEGGFIIDIAHPSAAYVSFVYVLLLFLGVWLLLEFIEYIEGRGSLIRSLLSGDFAPLIAIVVATFTWGVLMELSNIPAFLWEYTHWPFSAWNIGGIPLSVLLVGWPVHYIAFLSLFQVFIRGKTFAGVWK
ncbi:MAG: hypothetical protein HYT39_00885 [Candidatus Sungbacteria bacterium]|nr:hypothetical protein [Candidatus Sungbacteria bacterium]